MKDAGDNTYFMRYIEEQVMFWRKFAAYANRNPVRCLMSHLQ